MSIQKSSLTFIKNIPDSFTCHLVPEKRTAQYDVDVDVVMCVPPETEKRIQTHVDSWVSRPESIVSRQSAHAKNIRSCFQVTIFKGHDPAYICTNDTERFLQTFESDQEIKVRKT